MNALAILPLSRPWKKGLRLPKLRIPKRITRPRRVSELRSFPGHRAWVRRHHCSVIGCDRVPVECAHVRGGTDGGQGLKPSDQWTISLCRTHHAEQHRIGERAFEERYGLDLLSLAAEFARRSPHRHLWETSGAASMLRRRCF
jgi:hypothetical protein